MLQFKINVTQAFVASIVSFPRCYHGDVVTNDGTC